MYLPYRKLIVLIAAAIPIFAQRPVLRVCADPNNLPFSNRQGQGFENKLAEFLAANMNTRLEYTWWSERKNFAKQSLTGNACDAVMGVPTGMEDVLTTDPYYGSTYVFVSRRDRDLHITSLLDPRLSDLRIGVHVVGDDFAPPAYFLAHRGITRNVTGFSLFGTYGDPSPARKLVAAVENGDVDIAIVWGPIAGYFAQSMKPSLAISPVRPSAFQGIPFTYQISAAVRPRNQTLQAELNRILASQAPAIRQILTSYDVPEFP
jgi:mxaJ protein